MAKSYVKNVMLNLLRKMPAKKGPTIELERFFIRTVADFSVIEKAMAQY